MQQRLLLLLFLLPLSLFSQTQMTSADALFKSKEYKKAIYKYSEIVKADPSSVEALEKRADCYYELKEFINSVNDYSQALTVDSLNSSILSKRAGAFFMTKEYEKSITDYSRLISLNPREIANLYFMRGLSKSLLPKEDVEGACMDFRKAKSLGFNTAGLAGMNKYCNATDIE
jgi:tetratricopeptide (TPR) repeat protein